MRGDDLLRAAAVDDRVRGDRLHVALFVPRDLVGFQCCGTENSKHEVEHFLTSHFEVVAECGTAAVERLYY